MRFNAVEFVCFDQGRDDRPVLSTRIMSGEEGVHSVERDGADCTLDCVVFEFDVTIGEEQAQAVPELGYVFQSFPCRRLCGDTGD